MLARYSVLGPVTFVLAELPSRGTAGTGLDEPCVAEHHGIVISGAFSVHHADGRSETHESGTAFYVAPGPPTHTFTCAPGTVVGGFAASAGDPMDTLSTRLAELRFEIVDRPHMPEAFPRTVTLGGAINPFRPGAIEVEGTVMGEWLFLRATFGARSGYTSGWCDLPHWGIVLAGEVAILYEGDTELAAGGDAYFARPGHRFVSPDGATIADYTPMAALTGGRISRWHRASIAMVPASDGAPAKEAPPPAASTRRASGGPGRVVLGTERASD
jgi:hypothetical protein